MTLKRLAILLAILIFLAGVGIAWLWQYAYTPQGRARVIIAQLKNDGTTLRGWMLQHHLVRPGFSAPVQPDVRKTDAATNEMVKLGHEALPIAIEALRDNDLDVRVMAIWACGELRDPAAIQPLVECLRDAKTNPPANADYLHDSTAIQNLCLESMLEIGPQAGEPLLQVSKECDPRALRSIPDQLAAAWGAAAVPALMGMLDNPVYDIRATVARELGGLKDKRATDALIRLLSDPDCVPGVEAAGALGDIGDAKAIPPLLKMLHRKDTEKDVRLSVAVALGRMGQDEGLKYIQASPEPVCLPETEREAG